MQRDVPFLALPIARAAETALLLQDGSPVWPVAAGDAEALGELAAVFGCEIAPVEPERCRTAAAPPGSGSALVGCFDEELVPVAMLYAHLTGRGWTRLRSLEDLRSESLQVVLLDAEELTFELLEVVTAAAAPARGIVTGDGYRDVRRQALLRAATTRFAMRSAPHRVDVLPAVPVGTVASDARTLIGGSASAEELRSALERGESVVHVLAHSDGIDAFLANDLLLCPMTPALIGARTSAMPRCALTKFCHVENAAFEEIRRTGRLIHPRELRAPVLVYNSCWGILPANGWVDTIWSSGFSFASNPQIGALITTWEISVVESSDADVLIERILLGETLGEAVAAYNTDSEAARTRGHRLALFGDPAMTLCR